MAQNLKMLIIFLEIKKQNKTKPRVEKASQAFSDNGIKRSGVYASLTVPAPPPHSFQKRDGGHDLELSAREPATPRA